MILALVLPEKTTVLIETKVNIVIRMLHIVLLHVHVYIRVGELRLFRGLLTDQCNHLYGTCI